MSVKEVYVVGDSQSSRDGASSSHENAIGICTLDYLKDGHSY
jgi:hypothetical protein